MDLITQNGGTIELGTTLTKTDVEKLKSNGHVVNCLGGNAGTVGGGEFKSRLGEHNLLELEPIFQKSTTKSDNITVEKRTNFSLILGTFQKCNF